jgi:hypothetical protein
MSQPTPSHPSRDVATCRLKRTRWYGRASPNSSACPARCPPTTRRAGHCWPALASTAWRSGFRWPYRLART